MNAIENSAWPEITYLNATEATNLARHLDEWVRCGRTEMPLEFLLAFARLEARGELKVKKRNEHGECVLALSDGQDVTASNDGNHFTARTRKRT